MRGAAARPPLSSASEPPTQSVRPWCPARRRDPLRLRSGQALYKLGMTVRPLESAAPTCRDAPKPTAAKARRYVQAIRHSERALRPRSAQAPRVEESRRVTWRARTWREPPRTRSRTSRNQPPEAGRQRGLNGAAGHPDQRLRLSVGSPRQPRNDSSPLWKALRQTYAWGRST